MHNFKELKVWQKAVDFAVEIYAVTKVFPSEEKFGLVSQMRRAHRTGLITAERVKELEENLSELQRMINGLKASLAPLT